MAHATSTPLSAPLLQCASGLKQPCLPILNRLTSQRGFAVVLVLAALTSLAQTATAAVLFDNYRGTLRVPGTPLAPNYINDNGAHTGLTNLINFATANPNNIASSGSYANIDWSQNSFGLCNNESANGLTADACVNQIQGKRIYTLVKFPAAGTYSFQVAHDDEVKVDFSTNYSAANAGNYRNFDYNVPVGSVAAYTAGDNAYEAVPGKFIVPQAGSCYVMRVYWNNRGGKNLLRMRWQQGSDSFAFIPAENLLDPSDPAAYESCVNLQTDLGVQKAGPANFEIGKPFDYKVTVWNQGPVATTSATVADTLPANVDWISGPDCVASGGAQCASPNPPGAGNAFVMVTGALPVNASPDPKVAPTTGAYLTYTFRVQPKADAVSITNTAAITVNDLNTENNASSVTSTKLGFVSVKKTGPATVVAGLVFDYVLTVTNGQTQAVAVPTVAELMPANMHAMSVTGANCGAMPSAAGALLKCTLPAAIPAGGSASFTILTRADTPGSVTNYASTSPSGSTTPGTPGSNCTQTAYSCTSAKTEVTPAPAVQIKKSFRPISIPVNGTSLLRITIDNSTSTSWLREVKLSDTMPDNVLLTGTQGQNTCGGTLTASSDLKTLTLSRGVIQAGTQCFVEWNVTSAVVGPHDNTIPANNLSSLEGATNTTPATATLQVRAPAALSVQKVLAQVNGQPVPESFFANPGDQLKYLITVTNTGGLPGSTLLTETVPANTIYTGGSGEGWSTTPACAAADSSCTQSVSVPANGTPQSVSFTVTVQKPAPTATSAVTAMASSIANEVISSADDCSQCSVFTPVSMADLLATGATTQEVTVGTPVNIITSCTNAGPGPGINTNCTVTGAPPGATTVCTPPPPVARLPVGGTISCVTSFTPTETGTVTLTTTVRADSSDAFPDNDVAFSALIVTDAAPQVSTPVPVDTRWMLALMALALAVFAAWRLRRA